MERLDEEDRKRRRHHKPAEDKYKDEKEYWKVKKAQKFSNRDEDINELDMDRSNMLLFPTIASCTSSDEEPKKKRHHHHRHHHHFIVCKQTRHVKISAPSSPIIIVCSN